jgi:hypothetical protein
MLITGYLLSKPEFNKFENFNDSKISENKRISCVNDGNTHILEKDIVDGCLADPYWANWSGAIIEQRDSHSLTVIDINFQTFI